MSAHNFEFDDIDGSPLPLSRFRGNAVLVVNTASECGFTPQYADLQALWQRYCDRGLVVLGVPSNDFGGQEPGDEAQIKSFCAGYYHVNFPMTAKQTVIGSYAHPFYKWIVEELGEAGAPLWNFHKYLIAPDGSLAGLWPADVTPLDKDLTDTIDGALGSSNDG